MVGVGHVGFERGRVGRQLLAGWLSWASHSRIPEFVALARTIRRYRGLTAAIWHNDTIGASIRRSLTPYDH
jgi:hypothetical protein